MKWTIKDGKITYYWKRKDGSWFEDSDTMTLEDGLRYVSRMIVDERGIVSDNLSDLRLMAELLVDITKHMKKPKRVKE